MKPRAFLFLAIFLLGLAASLSRVPAGAAPLGDEASHALIAASLWHERDLTFDHRDLLRAYRIWNQGPAGLTLFTDDGGKSMHFGRPLPYPLAALPFYGLFGVRGLALFNMVLYLLLFWAFLRTRCDDGPGATAFVVGSFLASAALAYVVRAQPEVFVMACTGFPLLVWWRHRASSPPLTRRGALLLAGCGVLLAAGAVEEPLAALFALPIVVDLALRRKGRELALVLAAALLTLAAFAALQHRTTGEWTALAGAQRRSFAGEFPIESPRDLWAAVWEGEGREPERDLRRGLSHLGRNLGYVVVGRQVGLLPYLPFALLALLVALRAPRERHRSLLLAALAAYVVGFLLWHGDSYQGSAGLPGSRYLAAVAPVFLLLPARLAAGRWLVAPFLAAALWTSGALAGALSPVAERIQAGAQLLEPAYLRLPLETTLLGRQGPPGYAAQSWQGAVWLVPVESFYVEEKNADGVWVRGASRSQVIVVSPQPLRRLAFVASSLSDQNVLTLDSGADRLTVRFDSEGKRNGTPVDLALEPMARDLGFFAPGAPDYVYRFTIATTDGVVPARRSRKNHDPRYLGAFLDFTER